MASTNLPIQLTSFIGRESELAEVEDLLRAARLVTLTGPGGSGKTRLAIQAAAAVEAAFADGVWLVELAALRDAVLVPQAIGQVFGLRPAPDQPLLDALIGYLGSKQLLILLDNCEHLLETCAVLAQDLLSKAAGLRILATSREPLAVDGERVYPVPGLSWPMLQVEAAAPEQKAGMLQSISGYDAVRLLVDRARSASPHFKLTVENAAAILEICRRLDGLPLALELASARANVLTVQEISARLDDRFALLTSGASSKVGRHQTLRAAVDWSYALLTGDEQRLLNRLAVFIGSFSLDTVESVCEMGGESGGLLLDRLSSLVSKSFVIAETTDRAQARYRLLETIREYAFELLKVSGEADRLRDRHLDLYLARAEEAGPKLGDAYQQLWLDWLEGEHDNLRAALSWALESGRIETGLRICLAVARFWEIRGFVPEGMRWFERLLTWADERIPLVVQANAFTYASHLSMFLSNAPAAAAYASEAVRLAEAAGEEGKSILVMALGGLASSAEAAGDFQTAYSVSERALALLQVTPVDAFLAGMTYLGGGNIAVEAGHYDRSRELLAESLRMAREAGDKFRIAHTFATFGNLELYEGNFSEARKSYEKSVALLSKLDARHDLASLQRNLGRACLLLGEPERARALFLESLAAHQAEQNAPGTIECLIGLGSTAVEQKLYASGVRLLTVAAALRGQCCGHLWPAKPMVIEPYLERARAHLDSARYRAEAEAGGSMSFDQAIEFARNLPHVGDAAPPGGRKLGELSDRERQVTAMIAHGKTNGEIADELVLSKRTVEKHMANILARLELSSRSQLVGWAIENGLTKNSG